MVEISFQFLPIPCWYVVRAFTAHEFKSAPPAAPCTVSAASVRPSPPHLQPAQAQLVKMPPKKKAAGPSKKNVEKAKDKSLEDKTFGLKNKKKSKNVQKYIQEVTKQVKGSNSRADRLKEQEAKRKKDAKAEQENLKSLFAAAITQPKVR